MEMLKRVFVLLCFCLLPQVAICDGIEGGNAYLDQIKSESIVSVRGHGFGFTAETPSREVSVDVINSLLNERCVEYRDHISFTHTPQGSGVYSKMTCEVSFDSPSYGKITIFVKNGFGEMDDQEKYIDYQYSENIYTTDISQLNSNIALTYSKYISLTCKDMVACWTSTTLVPEARINVHIPYSGAVHNYVLLAELISNVISAESPNVHWSVCKLSNLVSENGPSKITYHGVQEIILNSYNKRLCI